MTIYIVQVFLIWFLGLLFRPGSSDKRKHFYLLFIFLMLMTVSSIRAFSVGADTKNYVSMFNNTQFIGILNTRIETGFMVYLKLLHLLSDDPGIMLFVSSVICIGSVCLFTNMYSKDPVMSMLLYVLMGAYFSQMNAMRQALALSFTEIAFMIMLSGPQKIKSVIAFVFILLATSIHTIAIIIFIPFLMLLFAKNKEVTRLTVEKALIYSFGFAFVGFVCYSLILRISSSFLPQYAYYFNSAWSDANYNASLFAFLISSVFAIAGAMTFRGKKLNYIQRFSVIMVGFSIFFNVLSMRMEIWSRITGMFSIYTYLLWVPEFTNQLHSIKNRRFLNACIILFSLAYMLVILIFRPEWTLVIPYRIRSL